MDRAAGAGGVLTIAGLAGYVVGIGRAFPGRGFSVTAVMIGLTLLALGVASEEAAEGAAGPGGRAAPNAEERP